MRRVMFFFLDGVGLGPDDPETNPFSTASLPHLHRATGGQRLVLSARPFFGPHSAFVPTDAQMHVPGLPQSASGQASLLTGKNVPSILGQHYGPKPNAAIRDLIGRDNLFMQLKREFRRVALGNAYPPGYFDGIESGQRLHGTMPMAFTAAGGKLFTTEDMRNGQAFSADWTGEGWRSELGIADVPLYSAFEAGHRIAEAALNYEFYLIDHWPTDLIGHRGDLKRAVAYLERFDSVLGGFLSAWDTTSDLVVITSDHGNIESIGNRKHTANLVPTIMIGDDHKRVSGGIRALMDIAPAVRKFLAGK